MTQEYSTPVHDALCVLDYFRKKYPALVVPGATTSVGNIYVEFNSAVYKKRARGSVFMLTALMKISTGGRCAP